MFQSLDPLLHNQLRLAIVSMLVVSKEIEFSHIQTKTNAASGNVSIQIKKLSEAGYLSVSKSFVDNRPKTMLSITKEGISAFDNYVVEIKKYLHPK